MSSPGTLASSSRSALWLYIANVSLLATHQVDAAFWEEWDTFRLPIGIEGFLVFNAVVLIPLLYGLTAFARHGAQAARWSYLAAGLGLFTFSIHAVILVLGNDDFRSTISIGLLIAILLVSVAQGVATRRATGDERTNRPATR